MKVIHLAFAVACVAGGSAPASAQNYHAIRLDGVPLGSPWSQPFSMSSCGNVTLSSKSGQGFVYHDGVYKNLGFGLSPTRPGKLVRPLGMSVNNYGDVTGFYFSDLVCTPNTCLPNAFSIVDGQYKNLSFAAGTVGMGINDALDIVVSNTTAHHPYSLIFAGDTKTTETGVQFTAINNDGVIAGTNDVEAFVYRAGVYTGIPIDGRSNSVLAAAINDLGDVVGTVIPAQTGVPQGYVYSGGSVLYVGPGPAPFDAASWLYAINNRRQAVGVMYSSDNEGHAMLYDNGTIVDLNDVSDAPLVLTSATGISDGGEIAVLARGIPFVLIPNGEFPPDTCKTH